METSNVRAIIIPNAHGCYTEVKKIITTCNVQSRDRIYMVGNILNGGPEPYHTMNFLLHTCKNIQFVKGDFEKRLEHVGILDECVDTIIKKYPRIELALYHLDILKNAPEYVQLPMCYLARYGMLKCRTEVIPTPCILSGGNIQYSLYYKPYIFKDAMGDLCVSINTHILQKGNLTAIVIDNDKPDMYYWNYVNVPAIKKYAN